jgi:uncharacterized protein YggE
VPLTHHAADAATPPSTTANTITVTGDGQVQVTPDVAFVTVGVQQTDIDPAKAQGAANGIANAALAKIKALGIPERDIQTQSVSLDPQYDDRGVLTGFIASDTFTITVEHTGQAGAVIDAGVGAGANRNISVSFGLKDETQARTAALKAAVAVAQRKATAVAAQLGVSLQGAKVQVQESSAQAPVPLFTAQRVATGAPVASPPTPVQTGVLSIQDSVTITYTY